MPILLLVLDDSINYEPALERVQYLIHLLEVQLEGFAVVLRFELVKLLQLVAESVSHELGDLFASVPVEHPKYTHSEGQVLVNNKYVLLCSAPPLHRARSPVQAIVQPVLTILVLNGRAQVISH